MFSQGLSPNARLALTHSRAFGRTVLVSAARGESGERSDALKRAEETGVTVIEMPAAPEYEVLLRILGPLIGYAVALQIAAAQRGVALRVDANAIATAITNAIERTTALLSGSDRRVFSDPITFVTTGGYGALTSNLCAKVTEGMFLQTPVAVDAIEFAHGTLQQAVGRNRTFIALSRNVAHDAELLARVHAVLEPQHHWLEMQALLPEPFQIFEHEAAMNVLVLDAIADRHLDQKEWPGKAQDQPLYSVGSVEDLRKPIASVAQHAGVKTRRLADMTWPEVEARVKAGERTVVLPLGATEQHGPHLPLAVDTLVADALAERFCIRIPGSLQAPTIAIGCSPEHLDFPGTLSLKPETLRGVIGDSLSCLVRHGFTHIVVFSAHGGNDALLAEIEPDLHKRVAPALLTVVHGIEAIGKVWLDASQHEGVPADASGAHSGEFETSIVAGLRPDWIRWQQTGPGIITLPAGSQDLFYPSLRDHAPNGVIGDPRVAASERAERYLTAWVDVLVAAYQRTLGAAT